MNYLNYPSHCNFPDSNWENFHSQHIPVWEEQLRELKFKENNVGIEIGSYCGGSAVWCLENIINKDSGKLYCIDIEETDYLKNNLQPYKNVQFIKGNSLDILRTLSHNGVSKEFADYVYVDGSHIAKNVLEDAVLSWELLKQDGIIIFDDYGWGYDRPDTEKPSTAIDAFMYIYNGLYEIKKTGWQIFLKKKKYILTQDYLQHQYKTL
jgi:cephalosporin hydroxylase